MGDAVVFLLVFLVLLIRFELGDINKSLSEIVRLMEANRRDKDS